MLFRGQNPWGVLSCKRGGILVVSRFARYDICIRLSHAIFIARSVNSRQEKIVYNFHDIKLPVDTIDCRSFFKYILKAQDIFHVVHDNRRLYLYETTRFVDLSLAYQLAIKVIKTSYLKCTAIVLWKLKRADRLDGQYFDK